MSAHLRASLLLGLALLGCDERTVPGDAALDDAALDAGAPAPGEDAGATEPGWLPSRFDDTAAAWPTPARAPYGYLAFEGPGWATVDLDGDGRVDLVSTSADGRVVAPGGPPRWTVHRNLGDGFAEAPFAWPIPDGPPGGFAAVAGPAWSLVDLDGDARPDLVWTADPSTRAVFGHGTSAHWRVFRNVGDGFSPTAHLWPVPDTADEPAGYAATAGRRYALVDLDGDGRPDLVSTARGDGRVHGLGSSPHWRVHRNVGDGFAPEAAAWPVPAAPELAPGFAAVAAEGWALVDWDADGRPDLVWTQDPTERAVFGWGLSAHWRVFANHGSGFAPGAALVAVPDPSSLPRGFDRVAEQGWALVDLDADRRPDLVWARDPETGGVHGLFDRPHWQVFLNRGDRLEVTPAVVAVPNVGELALGFNAVSTDGWRLVDLDGRGPPELVWTRPAPDAPQFGLGASPHWRAYVARR